MTLRLGPDIDGFHTVGRLAKMTEGGEGIVIPRDDAVLLEDATNEVVFHSQRFMGEHVVRHDPIRAKVVARGQQVSGVHEGLFTASQPHGLMMFGVTAGYLYVYSRENLRVTRNAFQARRSSQ